ncbi:unnamed protein product [Linum tenue]|uniref:Gustatory receptor n=2 Tax=Linum tenue TaxID=586396 RepID=A0AAV0HA10_9ROSI|nr:unnamed protein product [Linum tenue]
MADPHLLPPLPPPPPVPETLLQIEPITPLLNFTQNNNNYNQNNHRRETLSTQDDDLDQTLQKLETFLCFLGFSQSSVCSFLFSWAAFGLVGVALPVIILELSNCPGCEKFQIKNSELDIVASQACLAAVSLICLSHNMRKYGVKKFLFVDRYSGQMTRLSRQYIAQIKDSLRLLVLWSLPCFILKVAREVIRISYVKHESWLSSSAILFGLILSWSYVSTISLSASVIFHMVCNLQVIHFEDYGKLLERESDVLVFIEEHIRLRYNLSKISHRFRIFLVLQFIVVTASQFMTLFQVTGYSGIITVINGGDFVVSSIVQVVGIILSLHAATRISHRAQAIACLASRWHALATCNATANGSSDPSGYPTNALQVSYSESDLESFDYIAVPTNTQLASYMTSYHRRQAFVLYLQNNPGGITIFGWTVDRGLLNTIFFIELTLVTFLLGKTLVFSSSS